MIAWERLNRQIVDCRDCPRLIEHCQQIAREKRRAYTKDEYWGRPVPNFGDSRARLLLVGLAPAAHGANRTGRMFTGDRSGEWLYRALFNAGFANQPHAEHHADRLKLINCAITATCHCAPPDNKPAREEIANCRKWLDETLDLLPVQVFVGLGKIGWDSIFLAARRRGWCNGPVPKFGHGIEAPLAGDRLVIASYHPSQQNTFTGKLTEPMFDAIFARARQVLDLAESSSSVPGMPLPSTRAKTGI